MLQTNAVCLWNTRTVVHEWFESHVCSAQECHPQVIQTVVQMPQVELPRLQGVRGRLLQHVEAVQLVVHRNTEQPHLWPEADEAFRPAWQHGLPVLRGVVRVIDRFFRYEGNIARMSGRWDEGARMVILKEACTRKRIVRIKKWYVCAKTC